MPREHAMTTTTDLDDVAAIVGAFETQLGDRTIPFGMIARFRGGRRLSGAD
jgi:hypothetical protein